MTKDSKLLNKIEIATKAAQFLIDYLQQKDLLEDVDKLAEILEALKNHLPQEAIRLERTRLEAKEELSEKTWHRLETDHDEDTLPKLMFLAKAHHSAIGNIRVYLKYKIDHKPVNLDYNLLNTEAKNELMNEFR